MASYLSNFFIPQVLPLALATLTFATVPPIVLWRRLRSAKVDHSQVSHGRGADFFLAVLIFWGIVYIIYIGVLEPTGSPIPVWVIPVLLTISGLALADLAALARKKALWVTVLSVLCLGLSLALFSALPSVQLSSYYEFRVTSAGFPLSWYSDYTPTLGCRPYCVPVEVYHTTGSTIQLDQLLLDTLAYASLASLLIGVTWVKTRPVKAMLPDEPSNRGASRADSLTNNKRRVPKESFANRSG